jgi:Putative DNA-binding domain
MPFTALHRALGVVGPLTNDLLDRAVAAGVSESTDLDWKSALPPARNLPQTDFPKDIAAMANSGGGLIIYGVTEEEKRATGRVDVGELDESHERSLRTAATTAISPPIFGLTIHRLGGEGGRAVIVEVSASSEGPHLVYRNELFGAPIRNDADTVWMKEREIEAAYRSRFDGRRRAAEDLSALYTDAIAGRDVEARSWLVAVARPQLPRVGRRLSRDDARDILGRTEGLALVYASHAAIHPLESVDRRNPRPGLRRRVAVNTATEESTRWKESWIAIHDEGAISLVTHIGGHRISSDGYLDEWQIQTSAIESAIADLMALARTTADTLGISEYDAQVGIEWSGTEPLVLLTKDQYGYAYDSGAIPLHRYTPVQVTIDTSADAEDYYWQVHDLAKDCINQGGVEHVRSIQPPPRAQEAG